jgi:hypothetical protein
LHKCDCCEGDTEILQLYDKGGAVDKENILKILRINIVKIKQEEIFGRALYIYESNSYIQNLLLNEEDKMLKTEFDRSSYYIVSQEVMEMKTLLLNIWRLLEKVSIRFILNA